MIRSISPSEVPYGASQRIMRFVSFDVGSSDFSKLGTTTAATMTSTPASANAGTGLRTNGASIRW